MSLADLPPGYDLNLVPAGVPPPGVIPVIGGGPSLGVAMVTLEAVMMGLAVVVVSMRLFFSWHTRGTQNGGLNASDWTCLGALIISIGQSGIIVTREYQIQGVEARDTDFVQCTTMRATSGTSRSA